MGTLGKYVNKNFDLLINIFNDCYKYPKYTKDNKLHNKGDKYYFFDAIKEFEKNIIFLLKININLNIILLKLKYQLS